MHEARGTENEPWYEYDESFAANKPHLPHMFPLLKFTKVPRISQKSNHTGANTDLGMETMNSARNDCRSCNLQTEFNKILGNRN